jgi:hypothetical protein
MSRCAGPRATDRDAHRSRASLTTRRTARGTRVGGRGPFGRAPPALRRVPRAAARGRPRPPGGGASDPPPDAGAISAWRYARKAGDILPYDTAECARACEHQVLSSRRRRRRRHLIRLTSGLSGHSHGSTTISTSPSCAYSALTRSPGLISLVLHICPVATSSPALRYRPPGRLLRWLTTHASDSAGPP